FQAEDGIRDFHVTGVQTCALPISLIHWSQRIGRWFRSSKTALPSTTVRKPERGFAQLGRQIRGATYQRFHSHDRAVGRGSGIIRSEERRVGKECRSGRAPSVEREK